MPLYEFKCKYCENVQEVFMKLSDAKPKTCQACGKDDALLKLISATSFVLKGNGWYETDFKNK